MTADAADGTVPSLKARRSALLARPGLTGGDLCRAYAAEADDWLAGLLHRATEGRPQGLALLAAGGYGRGELAPGSDLDVILLHNGRRDVAAIAEALWYPVWDQGIHLDHSVRTSVRAHDTFEIDCRRQHEPVVVVGVVADQVDTARRAEARHCGEPRRPPRARPGS